MAASAVAAKAVPSTAATVGQPTRVVAKAAVATPVIGQAKAVASPAKAAAVAVPVRVAAVPVAARAAAVAVPAKAAAVPVTAKAAAVAVPAKAAAVAVPAKAGAVAVPAKAGAVAVPAKAAAVAVAAKAGAVAVPARAAAVAVPAKAAAVPATAKASAVPVAAKAGAVAVVAKAGAVAVVAKAGAVAVPAKASAVAVPAKASAVAVPAKAGAVAVAAKAGAVTASAVAVKAVAKPASSSSTTVGASSADGDTTLAVPEADDATCSMAFSLIDRNRDGVLTRIEVIRACREQERVRTLLGLPQQIRQEDGSREAFEAVFQRLDTDESKSIDYEEFKSVFLAKKGKKQRNKGGGGGTGEADPAKAAEKAEKARLAKEAAAVKKAEAAASRKEQAALLAKQRAEAHAASKLAEEESERLAADLGIGSYELKGDRGYMEDRVSMCRLPSGELYAGVYDGHCGQGAAEFAKHRLHGILLAQPNFASDLGRALHDTFMDTNAAFCSEADDESGTTAVVAVLRGNQLVVSNAGDSRASICSKGVGTAVTKDHKPEDPEEEERVRKAGGKMEWGRVAAPDGKNYLACARSLGDSKFKVGPPERHTICAMPDVFHRTIGEAALALRPALLWPTENRDPLPPMPPPLV